MIQLYGFIRSRSNRPHWALEEIGADYEFYQLDFTKGDNRSDYYRNINPSGKMPALRDGDLVLTESGAICNYLGEKFPESGLVPPGGTRERAIYDQWICFILTELEQPLWTAGKHRFGLPEKHRMPAIEETAQYEFRKAAELFSKGLDGREFFLADRFTMLDIFGAHTLRWAFNFKYSIEYPHLEDYLERMEKRPAFKRMLDTKQLAIPRD